MITFTNPYTTIKHLKQDLLLAESDKSFAEENLLDLHEDYDSLVAINASHAALTGPLRAEIDNLNDQFFKDQRTLNELTVELMQNEEGLYAHMQEREELLDIIDDQDLIIDDLEEDLDELAEDVAELSGITLYRLATIEKQAADIKMLNELLIEGSAAYDNVVSAGTDSLTEAMNGYDQVRKDLAQANWAYQQLTEDYIQKSAQVDAMEKANTQSLSWVRQAEEALEAYGIRIEDTPVGPVVQLDIEALVNRVALDNVTQNIHGVN